MKIVIRKIVHTGAESAYDALTDPAQLSRWFTTSARADLEIDGLYSNADGDEGRFLELHRPYRLRFTWENKKHCPGTVVEISIKQIGGGAVEITVTHSLLTSDTDANDMTTGWSWALTSLKSFLETGQPIAFEQWQKDQTC